MGGAGRASGAAFQHRIRRRWLGKLSAMECTASVCRCLSPRDSSTLRQPSLQHLRGRSPPSKPVRQRDTEGALQLGCGEGDDESTGRRLLVFKKGRVPRWRPAPLTAVAASTWAPAMRRTLSVSSCACAIRSWIWTILCCHSCWHSSNAFWPRCFSASVSCTVYDRVTCQRTSASTRTMSGDSGR